MQVRIICYKGSNLILHGRGGEWIQGIIHKPSQKGHSVQSQSACRRLKRVNQPLMSSVFIKLMLTPQIFRILVLENTLEITHTKPLTLLAKIGKLSDLSRMVQLLEYGVQCRACLSLSYLLGDTFQCMLSCKNFYIVFFTVTFYSFFVLLTSC